MTIQETFQNIAEPFPTMRDRFAMAALTGDLASQSGETGEWTDGLFDNLAKRIYAIADAMLKAREPKP